VAIPELKLKPRSRPQSADMDHVIVTTGQILSNSLIFRLQKLVTHTVHLFKKWPKTGPFSLHCPPIGVTFTAFNFALFKRSKMFCKGYLTLGEFILGETGQATQNLDLARGVTLPESRMAEGEQRSSSTSQSYSSVWDTTPNRR